MSEELKYFKFITCIEVVNGLDKLTKHFDMSIDELESVISVVKIIRKYCSEFDVVRKYCDALLEMLEYVLDKRVKEFKDLIERARYD